MAPGDVLGPTCPTPVDRAAMVQHWEELTFIHWRYPADVVQKALPAGLEVETFDGSAWVGLIPFAMRVRLPGSPSVPWVSEFPETNVRTYVRGPDGERGIWFFSLDAARLGAVVTARTTYRLPYFWSRMRVAGSGGGRARTYHCRRRWPGPRSATSHVVTAVGEPVRPGRPPRPRPLPHRPLVVVQRPPQRAPPRPRLARAVAPPPGPPPPPRRQPGRGRRPAHADGRDARALLARCRGPDRLAP